MSSRQSPLSLPRHVLLPGAWWLGGVASSLLAAWSGAQATERPAPPAALAAEDRALMPDESARWVALRAELQARPAGGTALRAWVLRAKAQAWTMQKMLDEAPAAARVHLAAEAQGLQWLEDGDVLALSDAARQDASASLSPLGFFLVVDQAFAQGAWDDALRLRLLRLRQFPGDFAATWSLLEHLEKDQRAATRQTLAAALQEPSLKDTPAARILARALALPGFKGLDVLGWMASDWPQAARGWAYHRYEAAERCDRRDVSRCLAAHERAFQALPELPSNAVQWAAALEDAGRPAQAAQVLAAQASLYPAGAARQKMLETLQWRVAKQRDHWGRQEALAASTTPGSVEDWVALAELRAHQRQWVKARDAWQQVLSRAPRHHQAWVGLVQALRRGGDTEGALAQVQQARQSLGRDTPALLTEAVNELLERGRAKEAVQWGTRLTPGPGCVSASWWQAIGRAASKQGHKALARQLWQDAMEVGGAQTGLIADIVATWEPAESAQAQAWLAQWEAAHPGSSLAEDWRQQTEADTPAQRMLRNQRLEAAMTRAPRHYWPAYYRAWEAMREGRPDQVIAITDAALARVGEDAQGQRAELLAQSSDLLIRVARQNRGRQAALAMIAGKQLEDAQSLGVSRGWLAERRASLADLAGQAEEAGRQLLARAEAQPASQEAAEALLRHESDVARKHRWTVLHRLIERDPARFEPRLLAVTYHVMWGGSPVVALSHAQVLEREFPAEWAASRGPADKRKALQQLGDAQRFFREQYDQASTMAPSQRYVQWYDHARAQAQREGAVLLEDRLDLVNMRATLLGTDGIEVERGWHPVSGKLSYLRVGRSEIRAEYDAQGVNLLKISNSAGQWLSLAYDGQDQIRSLKTQAGVHLLFDYNAQGKPAHIELKGEGVLDVRYDEQGEVQEVKSETPQMALKITQTFQQLLSQVKALEQGAEAWPDLPLDDRRLQQLEQAQQKAATPLDRKKARLALATYLIEHVADHRDHAARARRLLAELLSAREDGPSELDAWQLQAAVQWHQLARKMQPHGLDTASWRAWQDLQTRMRLSLARPATAQEAAKAWKAVQSEPLGLMPSARWLAKSYLDNPGAWRRQVWSKVLPDGVPPQATALLVRRNGDVVLGSAKGLAVWRRGFWEWFGWDAQARHFSSEASPHAGGAWPVTALAEDARGQLWVGGSQGLAVIAGGYTDPARWMTGAMQGLPSPVVRQLLPWQGGMLVATAAGLRWHGAQAWQDLPASWQPWQGKEVTLLRQGEDGGVLVGTADGLWMAGASRVLQLQSRPVDDAQVVQGVLHVLQQQTLWMSPWPAAGQAAGPWERLPDQANILRSRRIESLVQVPVDGQQRLGILTDMGLSVFHDAHIEHKKLPLTDRDAGAQLGVAAADGLVLAGPDGVFRLQQPSRMGDQRGPVWDLLTLPEAKATFVARGSRLEVIAHEAPSRGAQAFAALRSRFLARGPQGDLVTHDGDQIVRVDPKSGAVTELFMARGRGVDGKPGQGSLSALRVTKDGTIWAASGASLFRHAHGETTEYSHFIDPAQFPSQSHFISSLVETDAGELWVVASDESHLQHQGRPMSGGLLRWTGAGFERIQTEPGQPWYFSSFTPLGGGDAVLGTNQGFVLRHDGVQTQARHSGGASYAALMARQPSLFLGTAGAPLGDSWIFGTPSGLVALHEGRWLALDRLNWLLPDPFMAPYGGRKVHAVSTDEAGRIYAGTDRGLMIYETGGQDFMQLLVSENLPDLAFSDLESRKLRDEAGAWLKHLPAGSQAGQKLAAVKASEAAWQQAKLRAAAAKPSQEGPAMPGATAGSGGGAVREGGVGGSGSSGSSASLVQELERREASHKRLLAQLEKDSLGLYQMLELKPIDLSVWRKRLGEGEVVVQYLPTRSKLLIHLASREGTEVREVTVPDEALFARSMAVAQSLGRAAKKLPALRGVAVKEAPGLAQALADAAQDEQLEENLGWLYEQLLRPVERELEGKRHVYIAPVGALAHVPFGALIRGQGETRQYAAQRHALGILPSLYLLDLVTRDRAPSSGRPVLFGDPDGSLPGAQQEVQALQGTLGPEARAKLGNQATRQALQGLAGEARWLHMATHGVLKGEDPTQSYLLLAGGERLTMVDAMELPLSQADTVVLSACESGVGRRGLDYATLSRAFGYAGAPSVVASLWSVHDDATRLLMERFYGYRQQGLDVFESLARAQRDLIAKGGAWARPEAWSAFQAFGKP